MSHSLPGAMGLTGPAAGFVVAFCSVFVLLLAPRTVSGQQIALASFGNGGEKTVGADFQMETIVGQPVVGEATGANHIANFGLWFAEFALSDQSTVSNETVDLPGGIPTVLTLEPNFPNPASLETTVRFGLPSEGSARLVVFDMLGRRVQLATDERRSAGWHDVRISTSNLPSGIYFVRIEADGENRVRPITVTH